jgi:hypothetical protein
MRLARKLFLVVVAAIVLIAFASSAANAVTVTVEPGGANCPEVQVNNVHTITGGCLVAATTNSATLRHHYPPAAEAVITTCTNSFSARIHRSGDGWLFNQDLEGANCFIEPCDEAEPSHVNYEWPATLMEFGPFNATTNPNNEALQVTFCIQPLNTAPASEGTLFGTCTIFIKFTSPTSHLTTFTTLPFGPGTPGPTPPGPPSASRCTQDAGTSLAGTWVVTGTPIEITH